MNLTTQYAIDALTHKEGMAHGIAKLIEALRFDFNLSYQEIADAGHVSIAGLKRWRENNYGEDSRVQPLVKWAQSKLNPQADETPAPIPTEDAIRNHSLGDIEAALLTSLQKLMGANSVRTLKVAELFSCKDGGVEINLRIE